MAEDVIAVVDALGAPSAHLIGPSLGATIAPVTAIDHPHRVASLTLQSATPGSALRIARPKIRTVIKNGEDHAPETCAAPMHSSPWAICAAIWPAVIDEITAQATGTHRTTGEAPTT
jgi:pimeloyl-ACP methyl ester carboxylesterase